MIGLLQRVTGASVEIESREVARIGQGLLVLVAVERDDTSVEAEHLLERLLHYRVFADAEGRMNLGVKDVGGGLLLVPQFTLAADTGKGLRPGFSRAAPPDEAERLFGYLVRLAREHFPAARAGQFGAHMQLSLVNDGPVTFWVQASRHGA